MYSQTLANNVQFSFHVINIRTHTVHTYQLLRIKQIIEFTYRLYLSMKVRHAGGKNERGKGYASSKPVHPYITFPPLYASFARHYHTSTYPLSQNHSLYFPSSHSTCNIWLGVNSYTNHMHRIQHLPFAMPQQYIITNICTFKYPQPYR